MEHGQDCSSLVNLDGKEGGLLQAVSLFVAASKMR